MDVRAVLWALAAAFCFNLETVFVKLMGGAVPVSTIVLVRALGQVAFTLPALHGHGLSLLRTDRLGLHLLRGGLSLLSWAAYYLSFQYLDLASATVISFTSVMFVTALAGPVLGEIVRWRRWSATLLGFAGVVMVARPGAGDTAEAWVFASALLSAACGAGIVLSTKMLARSERTQTIMVYIGIVTTLGALPFAVPALAWPGWTQAGWLLAMAISGPAGMFLWITALRMADASALAPVSYTRLIFALAIGFLVFREIPHAWTLAGAAVIVLSALYITYREAKVAHAKPAALAAKPPSGNVPRPER